MLNRILKLWWPITAVLLDEKEVTDIWIKTEQWKLAEDIVTAFEPFTIATTRFSSDENFSISSAFVILHGLLDHLEPKEESTSNTKVIKQYCTH